MFWFSLKYAVSFIVSLEKHQKVDLSGRLAYIYIYIHTVCICIHIYILIYMYMYRCIYVLDPGWIVRPCPWTARKTSMSPCCRTSIGNRIDDGFSLQPGHLHSGIAMGKSPYHHSVRWFTHYKWRLSIVLLVFKRKNTESSNWMGHGFHSTESTDGKIFGMIQKSQLFQDSPTGWHLVQLILSKTPSLWFLQVQLHESLGWITWAVAA